MKSNKKSLFRVIPAIDLMGGVVVHGVKGERENYQPVKSILSETAELFPIVEGFVRKLGLREFYIADLDAIMFSMYKDHLNLITNTRAEGLNTLGTISFMVDAGVFNLAGVRKIFETGIDQAIIGTETLPSLSILQDIINCYGADRLVVSLDTQDSKVLSAAPELCNLEVPQALRLLREFGIRHYILLELRKVGTSAGLNKELIQECLSVLNVQAPEWESSFLIGGGVSGYEDLHWLREMGVSGAIVATACHDGRLTNENLSQLNIEDSR
ncbi:MAG: HisA/HisF-related TIM barrel protein [Desulfosporosinus sp.]|nr:HisA/HisF-related TIM barrel protein [Desulfosporosinus sp.]